jgi:hypothetical protein
LISNSSWLWFKIGTMSKYAKRWLDLTPQP